MQISEWVTQSLSRIPAKVAINPELPSMGGRGLPRSVLAKEADPLRALAERTGAGLVVTGTYYLEGDRLRVQSRIRRCRLRRHHRAGADRRPEVEARRRRRSR